MSGYQQRFVGLSELPRSLTQADVDEAFQLSQADIEEVRAKFKAARLGAALQLVLIRATGRAPDRLTGIPRALLKSLCSALNLSETAIASLKTLYAREATRFAHQRWARERSGLTPADPSIMEALRQSLHALAGTAASVDELIRQGELWLYDRKHLLPGDRVLRDCARVAFATAEARVLTNVRTEIEPAQLRGAMAAVFSKRKGRGGGTVLEWLRTAPGKHSPTTLGDIVTKVNFLKSLGVDGWLLPGITNARLRAYAQAVIGRPPFDTERLSDDIKAVEIVCFLKFTLMELTDSAIYLAGRRCSDLVRSAAARVLSKQASSASELQREREVIKAVLYAESVSDSHKIEQLKTLIPRDGKELGSLSRAALVRQALAEDSQRVAVLLSSLADFDVKGDESQRSLKQLRALRELDQQGAKELPAGFDVSVAEPVWHELVNHTDRKKALAALRASAVTSIRKGLRGGRLWVDHSWSFRNREDLLLSPQEWNNDRASLIRALSLTPDPKKYLERVRATLANCVNELAKAVEAGRLELDASGRVRLTKIEALDLDAQALRSRTVMFSIIGNSQFADMIVELDARVGFSQALLGNRPKTVSDLLALYGALLAHGTENDAKGVAAMIPGLEVAQISAAMRALEGHGRLRRANERIVAFQRKHAIASLWGMGDKASADMMSLDASRHLYSARMEPRRKTPATGIYTHVMGSYGVFYDQPIVLNERQAAAAVHGVEAHNTHGPEGIRLSLLAVDTHGYTNAAMAVAKLLGFDLCARLRNLAERRIYLPRSFELPDSLERLAIAPVSERAIAAGWDELLRLVASIRGGKLSAKEALEKLGSAAKGSPMHKAADELGKLLRSIFLCDYFTIPDFRREIHTLLNRGESVHQLQRAIYYGRVAAERGRRRDELRAISGSHALLTNIVIAWNTMKMQEVADRWRKERRPIEDEWVRRMGPVHFGHINFRGTMSFCIDEYRDALLQTESTLGESQVA